jgi:hypothetical protein
VRPMGKWETITSLSLGAICLLIAVRPDQISSAPILVRAWVFVYALSFRMLGRAAALSSTQQ